MKLRKILLLLAVNLSLFFLVEGSVWADIQGSFRCSPATGTFKVGNTFTVDYILDTRSYVANGADVAATYDPSILEALSTQSTAITSVTHWTAPPTNTVDPTLGKIDMYYGSNQAAYTGVTSIGQTIFRAKTTGQAQFNFTFFQQYDDTTPGVAKIWGKRNGTNLSNTLTDVNNCIYTIEEASAVSPTIMITQPAVPVPTTTLYIMPTSFPSELPRAGRAEITFLLAGGSIALLFLGVKIALVK